VAFQLKHIDIIKVKGIIGNPFFFLLPKCYIICRGVILSRGFFKNKEGVSIKDIEKSFNSLLDQFEESIELSLILAVQSLEFNCPNIVVAVRYGDDIPDLIKKTKDIMLSLGYKPILVRSNRIKIATAQPQIIFESVLDKYKGSGFLNFSMIENGVIT